VKVALQPPTANRKPTDASRDGAQINQKSAPLKEVGVMQVMVVPFAPPVLAILGGIASLQLTRRRWIVHTITLVAMILALPIYIYFLGVLEPTSIQYPGPGDGFVALLYLVILLPTTLVYSVFSFFTRTRPGQTRPLQKSN
jgi:hypothetical protein